MKVFLILLTIAAQSSSKASMNGDWLCIEEISSGNEYLSIKVEYELQINKDENGSKAFGVIEFLDAKSGKKSSANVSSSHIINISENQLLTEKLSSNVTVI